MERVSYSIVGFTFNRYNLGAVMHCDRFDEVFEAKQFILPEGVELVECYAYLPEEHPDYGGGEYVTFIKPVVVYEVQTVESGDSSYNMTIETDGWEPVYVYWQNSQVLQRLWQLASERIARLSKDPNSPTETWSIATLWKCTEMYTSEDGADWDCEVELVGELSPSLLAAALSFAPITLETGETVNE